MKVEVVRTNMLHLNENNKIYLQEGTIRGIVIGSPNK